MKLFSVAFIFASIYYFAHCDDNNAKVDALKAQWEQYKVVDANSKVRFVEKMIFSDILGRV
jgi:hypothetical protein